MEVKLKITDILEKKYDKGNFINWDRPTGKLHIGHYIGSLKNRVKLQNEGKYEPYIMIADTQALTDNARDPEKIKNSLIQVALDYLAVGLDPESLLSMCNHKSLLFLN